MVGDFRTEGVEEEKVKNYHPSSLIRTLKF
jgi:hypothetical protein